MPELRLLGPDETTTPAPTASAVAALTALGLDETAAAALVAALRAAVRAEVAGLWADARPVRPTSPYDRLTPDEVRAELRIGKTSYHRLLAANVLRQLTDEAAGVVFVTRAELDRYKRETGTRTGPISNAAPRRRRAA